LADGWVFRVCLIGCFALSLSLAATPLDDQMAAFAKDPERQSEGALINVLKSGLKEQRSAEAYVAARPWLARRQPASQDGLYHAGLVAEYAGEWSAATDFYKALLNNSKPDARLAGMAVTSMYRLILNNMREPEAAYFFMRQEGHRLRGYGNAKQFDSWFLKNAQTRVDLVAVAERLAAIYNSPDNPALYSDSLKWLMQSIETFKYGDKALDQAMTKLASSRKAPKELKARWNFIKAIVSFSPEAGEFIHNRKEIPKELFNEPLKAAQALIAVQPYEGSILVASGWLQFNHGDTPTFFRFAHAQREIKAALLIQALQRLSPEQAKKLLNAGCQDPRGRNLTVATFLSPARARSLVPKMSTIFNSLSAPNAELWDKEITIAEAKALAPHLTRNPHPAAALVRAYAVTGKKTVLAMVPAMIKSERWCFNDSKTLIDTLWNSGCDRKDADYKKLVKQYKKPGADYDQLKKQIAKAADIKTRMAAFNTLYKELRGTPSMPSVLGLWDKMFKQAPNADKSQMLKKLTADFVSAAPATRELQTYLLRQSLAKINFGNPYSKLSFGPGFAGGWDRYGYKNVRKGAPELAAYLATLIRQQMQAGKLSEPIFGMWLHCVDPKKKESAAFMQELVKSPAYAKLDRAYHNLAAHSLLFGAVAMTEKSATDSRVVSRELLALPDEATPAQVEAALKAVMVRVSKASEPVTVIGLQKVAALPELKGATRTLVLSLFKDMSPLGNYPTRQGYDQLSTRLVNEMQEAKSWGVIIPYAANLWRCAESSDDMRYPHVADELLKLAESAIEAGAASAALSIAQAGLKSGISALNPNDRYNVTASKLRYGKVRNVAGKASIDIGVVEIPVDENDPDFGAYSANAEFVQGNLDTAWKLYEHNANKMLPIVRKLSIEYGFWVLSRLIDKEQNVEAEALVKELTIWSREEEGTFTSTQEAQLKIYFADLALLKGALPTARAWYGKVADARVNKGTEIYVKALLGVISVDRETKNFSGALTELDKLMKVRDQSARIRAHYARAQVYVDKENYVEAFKDIASVLRFVPNHPDALILKAQAQIHMNKLEDASEIPAGPRVDEKIIVPGASVKVRLNDPSLNVSGLGAEIEVVIWAASGDRERVMLHQMGDNKEMFRAELKTALGAPSPDDKTLQVLGRDVVKYGFSKRFREKMKDLPPDPKAEIIVASDARLDVTSGAFPALQGERQLDIEELGLSTAQQALGMRTIRPGNPFYIRVIDPDQSKTAGCDEIEVSVSSSSGDSIARMKLKETGNYSGEFTGSLPTASAQAMANASESAPGRDANMVLSSKPYPGWAGKTGSKSPEVYFTVDLNDNVPLDKMSVICGEEDAMLRNFSLQSSMNGREWVTRARYPEDPSPWDGHPQISSIPTFRNGIALSSPEGRELPAEWKNAMALLSARTSVRYLAAAVTNISVKVLPVVDTGHPGYSGLIKYRAIFYQPAAEMRRFRLTGYPVMDAKENIQTIFLLDGEPAAEESDDPMHIERELAPGLHEIQIWRHEGRSDLLKRKPVLLCNKGGDVELVPCPDDMFNPSRFSEEIRKTIDMPAEIKLSESDPSTLDISFADNTRARLVRLVIHNQKGVEPAIKKITMTDRDGKVRLPVTLDYQQLRDNMQLEVLPGDRATVRFTDDNVATKGRTRHEKSLSVAYNTAKMMISFLNYRSTQDGQVLVLEDIRRFGLDDSVAVIITDPDMDISPKRDQIEFLIRTSNGSETKAVALETEEHSGEFQGRFFPVFSKPERASEIQVTEGATLTAIYHDKENLDPGIPTDRTVTIEHAKYVTPRLSLYSVESKPLPAVIQSVAKGKDPKKDKGPEIVQSRNKLSYNYVEQAEIKTTDVKGVVGASLCFDVVAPHLAMAKSSEISAYVQTDAGRKAAKSAITAPYDPSVPGTMKLTAHPDRSKIDVPTGYELEKAPHSPVSKPPLDEGRFSFAIPLILGDPPQRSFAVNTDSIASSTIPEGLIVRGGETVHIGYAYKDKQDDVQWFTTDVKVGSHAFMDVMNSSYRHSLTNVYVGEKIYVRVLAPGLDQSMDRDRTSVQLKGVSGAAATFQLRETEVHSGMFKGLFSLSYADEVIPAELPPVELNGFPVRYGDSVSISYAPVEGEPAEIRNVSVNMGADGGVEPFSKRFTQDSMAIKTHFTLAECFFELAKQHKLMEQDSLARREMAHAQKLLAEAIASHRDDDMQAHAEYLLGNLSQEYAALAKNEESKMALYKDALSRFSKIPIDYPKTEFAPKAQFKTALVYEKMGEVDISVEEYVKLAYKYPDTELIPEVMTRLGGYFQAMGKAYKDKAEPLREKEDEESQASVLRFMMSARVEYHKAAIIFSKLEQRFPDHELAALAGLRSAQNHMRAEEYDDAIRAFQGVVANESYDGKDIRAQAMYWCGLSYERSAASAGKENWRARGKATGEAYKIYRRTTFDFPDSKWAKHARGRLVDPVFARIIEVEELDRERMIEALENSRR